MKPFNCAKPFDCRRKLETGVRNGDCLPGCFVAMLECIHRGCITSSDLEESAADLRKQLVQWIVDHWHHEPCLQPSMKTHEIIRMQHDFGIPEHERKKRGEWGESPSQQLEAYRAQADSIYFSDAEMIMFASWLLEERGLPVMFRTYRCKDETSTDAELITCTPDPIIFDEKGITEAVVVELDFCGTADAFSAHYKIIEGASLQGLTTVRRIDVEAPGSAVCSRKRERA